VDMRVFYRLKFIPSFKKLGLAVEISSGGDSQHFKAMKRASLLFILLYI
jgi:hypothetical protein